MDSAAGSVDFCRQFRRKEFFSGFGDLQLSGRGLLKVHFFQLAAECFPEPGFSPDHLSVTDRSGQRGLLEKFRFQRKSDAEHAVARHDETIEIAGIEIDSGRKMKILDDRLIAVFYLGLQIEKSFAGGCRDLDESSTLPIGCDDFFAFPVDAAGGAVRIDLLMIGLRAEQGAGF